MFGYFVRRVDKRFQLEKSMGLHSDKDGAVERLERLFSQVLIRFPCLCHASECFQVTRRLLARLFNWSFGVGWLKVRDRKAPEQLKSMWLDRCYIIGIVT